MANLNTTTQPPLFNVSDNGAVADELGSIRAKIKTLKDSQSFLESVLKDKGVSIAEGKNYRVSISYDVETQRTDWKAVATKLKPSRQLISAHSQVSVSNRIRVTAMTK